jgi:C2 domain
MGLVLSELYGTTCPYCVLKIDGMTQRTRCVQGSAVNPHWVEETITFDVTLVQWAKSSLHIQVCVCSLYLCYTYAFALYCMLARIYILARSTDARQLQAQLLVQVLSTANCKRQLQNFC